MNPPTSAADLLAAAAGRRQRAADVKLPEKFLSEFWEADGASADVVLGGVVDRDFIYGTKLSFPIFFFFFFFLYFFY
jgi:hypothetical protein